MDRAANNSLIDGALHRMNRLTGKRWHRHTGVPKDLHTVGDGTRLITDSVPPEILQRVSITAGRNCLIDLSGLRIVNSGLHIHMADDCELVTGPGQFINGHVRWFLHEPSSLIIGADCLWAQGDSWTSDMHSVVDAGTGERLNHARDIVIGPHVWLAHDHMLLGGTNVGANSIVAARAVVTGKSYPPNCLLAGVPARIVRDDVSWTHKLS